MRLLAHLVLFKGFYALAVGGAAHGHPWFGALALIPFVAAHLAMTPAPRRGRELLYVALAGLAGAAMDSGLLALGLTAYASSPVGWPVQLVPPWIIALWVAFATLPGLMRWLHGRPWLAAAFGALAGPLSFWLGSRLGAVELPEPIATCCALSLQYALVLPAMVWLAPGARAASQSSRSAMSASIART